MAVGDDVLRTVQYVVTPSTRAVVQMPASSHPANGSVSVNAVFTSPLSMPGRNLSFCWACPRAVKIGGIMLLVAAGGTLVAVVAGYLASRVASQFGRDLRNAVFSRVSSFSLQEFDRFGTATLITRTTNDINQVQQVLFMMLRMSISAPTMAVGGIVMAVSKDPTLSLVIVVIVPLLAAAIGIIAAKGMPLFQAIQRKVDHLNLVVREQLTGIRVIRAFNRTDHETRRFQEANRSLTETSIMANKIMAAMWPIMMLLLNFTTIAIVWFGGIRIENGYMQLGDLMAFIQYVMQIMFALMMVSMIFVMIPRASVSAGRISEVLETEPAIKDPSSPPVKSVTDRLPQGSHGTIEFRNVTFSYPGAEQPALRNISFKAGPGEVTAIIGSIGSGKTTLVNLIMRFYDVDEGSILIDGVDIRDWPQAVLRAKIGLVPQKSILFSGTIADNIRYGNRHASDDEVYHAARVAQALDFISELEDGFDAVIDQGGTNLSGGQKQRLTIARAVVRKPSIYIFDDTFSALDFKTEAKLRAALAEETTSATVIIVAQRVSTIMHADRILVLHEGRLDGVGTHEQLLRTSEVYREIVASQMTEEASA